MLDWLFPPRCIVCLELLPPGGAAGFCGDCALTPVTGEICNKCGAPADSHYECGELGFLKNRSVFIYDDIMRDTIHAFKYGNHPGHGKVLGGIMAAELFRHFENIGIIIPVPMHKAKERKRGYNQSAILAKEIARQTKISYDGKTLTRIRNTAPQSEMTAEERRSNLLGAFRAQSSAAGKDILLVDDIFTTGSTAKECSLELMRAGAASVQVYTLAIAVHKETHP